MKYLKKYLLILLSLLYSSVHAETIYCKATWISDGDTFTCTLAPKQKVTIRLYQIDAPEIGQNYGRTAQKALSELIRAKPVAIQTHGQDKYGRTLGRKRRDRTARTGGSVNRTSCALRTV